MSDEIEKTKLAAKAAKLASDAMAHAGTRKVNPAKVLLKAAADPEVAAIAIKALAIQLRTDESMLDIRTESMDNAALSAALERSAIALARTADVPETPDNLAQILSDRLERGFAYLPAPLLRSLYELGRSVALIKRGELKAAAVEGAAIGLMDEAERWASSMDDRRLEDTVLCPIRPETEPPF